MNLPQDCDSFGRHKHICMFSQRANKQTLSGVSSELQREELFVRDVSVNDRCGFGPHLHH